MSNGYDPRMSALKQQFGLRRDLKGAQEQFGRAQNRLSDYAGKKAFMTGAASKGMGLLGATLGSAFGLPPEITRGIGTYAGGALMDKYGNRFYGDAPEIGQGTFGLLQNQYGDLAESAEGIDPRITSSYQGAALGQGLSGIQGLDWGALGAQEGKYIAPSYKSSLGLNTPSFGNLQQSLLSLFDKSSDMVQKREPKSYDFSSPDFSESDLQELLQRNPNIKFTSNKEASKPLPEIDMNSVLNKVQERQEGMLGDLQLNELEFDDYSNLPDAPPPPQPMQSPAPSQPMQSLPPVDVMADNTTKWGETNPETGERVGGINPSLLNLFSGGKEAASSLFGNIADFASSPYEESGDASSMLSLLGMQQGGSPMQMPGVSKPIPYQKGGQAYSSNKYGKVSFPQGFDEELRNALTENNVNENEANFYDIGKDFDKRNISQDKDGMYTVKRVLSIPANQVGGDEGLRYYSATETADDLQSAMDMARFAAEQKMSMSPSDSMAFDDIDSYLKPKSKMSNLLKMFGRQQGGAIQRYNLGGAVSQQPMSYQVGGLLKYKRSPMG